MQRVLASPSVAHRLNTLQLSRQRAGARLWSQTDQGSSWLHCSSSFPGKLFALLEPPFLHRYNADSDVCLRAAPRIKWYHVRERAGYIDALKSHLLSFSPAGHACCPLAQDALPCLSPWPTLAAAPARSPLAPRRRSVTGSARLPHTPVAWLTAPLPHLLAVIVHVLVYPEDDRTVRGLLQDHCVFLGPRGCRGEHWPWSQRSRIWYDASGISASWHLVSPLECKDSDSYLPRECLPQALSQSRH